MKLDKNIYKIPFFGILIGIVNGLFGAGGGMIAVPLLKKLSCDQKNAHATSIAVILPLCVISAIIYFFKGNLTQDNLIFALKFLPSGLIGAVLGTFIMKKISPFWLRKIFAIFLIYAGIRMIF